MNVNVNDLLDAPQVDMPTVPGPVDCMPGMLAAGRVAPVVKIDYYGGTVWVLCDMGLARAALRDRRLSKDIELTPDWLRVPGEILGSQPSGKIARAMVLSEGEEHARSRALHARILTPHKVESQAGSLRQRAEKLLDGLVAEAATGNGEVNLVEHYTHPIPRGSICELLGLRPELHAELKRVTDDIIYSPDRAVRERGAGALGEAVAGWVNDSGSLNEGVITGLLQAVDEGQATMAEVVTWSIGLVMAGYESTASLISSAMWEALRRPAEQRPRSEAEIDAWVEETLRVHPPFPSSTWRFATEDLDIGGYFIPEGAPVLINVAAVNRCPHGELADEFDPAVSRDHLSFGLGRHLCLGPPLARLEARIALGSFLSRFPDAHLSETTEVGWDSGWLTRRISVLPVVLTGVGSAGNRS